MARGKKNLSLEEQLEKLDKDIEIAEENLSDMKNKRSEIKETIKMKQLSELNDLITSSGKSFEEVRTLLNNN